MFYERNVVILGKVGSGKKTLGNHIAGNAILRHESAFGARNAGHCYGKCEREGTLYQIQTFDTEGLQTGYQDPMTYIFKKLTFKTIHLIIFVIANGRCTDESHRSLIGATNSLPQQAKSLCALVITHCEGLTKEQQRDIVAEFITDARTAQVTAVMGKGIFSVGFPDISKLPPLLKHIYKIGIDADEKCIRRLVNECKQGLNTNAFRGQAVRQHQRLFSRPSASYYHQTFKEASPLHREASVFHEGTAPFRQVGASRFQATSSFRQTPPPFFTREASPFHQEAPRFQLVPVTVMPRRCVVLLGKSGAGKSTVANMLIGHNPLSQEEPPFGVSSKILQSVTGEVSHVTANFRLGGRLYSLKLIDTVGFFDTQAEYSFEKMKEYFKDFTDGISLFLFIFKKDRFTRKDQDVFSFIWSKFNQETVSSISALAVTACEQDSPEVREEFIQEFRSDPATHKIALQMQLGIYPVGFPSLKQMNPKFQSIHKASMEQDRDTLLSLITKSKRMYLKEELFQKKWDQ